jgi:hypothetical protein
VLALPTLPRPVHRRAVAGRAHGDRAPGGHRVGQRELPGRFDRGPDQGRPRRLDRGPGTGQAATRPARRPPRRKAEAMGRIRPMRSLLLFIFVFI